MLISSGILVAALIALGFLTQNFDPQVSSLAVKTLFFTALAMAAVSAFLMILYGVAVIWHQGVQYFLARYFGPEEKYFKTAFRRSILLGVLLLALIGLRRFGFFTQFFAAGAAIIIFLLELFYAAHDRKIEPQV